MSNLAVSALVNAQYKAPSESSSLWQGTTTEIRGGRVGSAELRCIPIMSNNLSKPRLDRTTNFSYPRFHRRSTQFGSGALYWTKRRGSSNRKPDLRVCV